MSLHRPCEGGEVVAAFECGDDAAVAVFFGEVDEEFGDPGEVGFLEAEVAEGIVIVGVEAGGDEQDLGLNLSTAGVQSRSMALRKVKPSVPARRGVWTRWSRARSK